MMSHVILMAVEVEGADSVREAEVFLHGRMPVPGDEVENGPGIGCWWTAEDERYDGSDCESAVFVPEERRMAGMTQRDARVILENSPASAEKAALIRAAAVAFLMGDDDEGIPLGALAQALGIHPVTVPALAHVVRPTDNADGEVVCKDCGAGAFWLGPGMSDWGHTDADD